METSASTARVALKWGLISALISIASSLAMFMSHQTGNQWYSVLLLIATVIFLVMAMKEFRHANNGYMTYGQGVGIGALMSAVGGFLGSAFNTFYMTLIDPNLQQEAIEQAREKMEEQGMNDDQIERALEMSQKFQTPGFTFVAGILATIVLGVLLSLIVAAFLRRNKPLFE